MLYRRIDMPVDDDAASSGFSIHYMRYADYIEEKRPQRRPYRKVIRVRLQGPKREIDVEHLASGKIGKDYSREFISLHRYRVSINIFSREVMFRFVPGDRVFEHPIEVSAHSDPVYGLARWDLEEVAGFF